MKTKKEIYSAITQAIAEAYEEDPEQIEMTVGIAILKGLDEMEQNGKWQGGAIERVSHGRRFDL